MCTPTQYTTTGIHAVSVLQSRFDYIDCWTRLGMFCAGPSVPSKLPIHVWGSGTKSNTRFLGSTESTHQMAARSVQPFFAQLTNVTDWPTDRPLHSVCSNRPHLASAAMRPRNHHGKSHHTLDVLLRYLLKYSATFWLTMARWLVLKHNPAHVKNRWTWPSAWSNRSGRSGFCS